MFKIGPFSTACMLDISCSVYRGSEQKCVIKLRNIRKRYFASKIGFWEKIGENSWESNGIIYQFNCISHIKICYFLLLFQLKFAKLLVHFFPDFLMAPGSCKVWVYSELNCMKKLSSTNIIFLCQKGWEKY